MQYNRYVNLPQVNVSRANTAYVKQYTAVVPRPLRFSNIIETFRRAAYEPAEEAHGIMDSKGRRLSFRIFKSIRM